LNANSSEGAEEEMATRANMFGDIDRMDAAAWASYLAPDAVMRFGNAEPVNGRDACRDALAGFYDTIKGLRHQIVEQWVHGSTTIVEAVVTYTRGDDRQVDVPVVTVYRTNPEDLIADYRVYIDLAPVFADA
jgi:ketosteroid isomerase-like protein